MTTFLKTLIGGALGIGALYAVGKICYEAGRNVAEVERQLAENKPAPETDIPVEEIDEDNSNPINGPLNMDEKIQDMVTEAEVSRTPSKLSRAVNKIKNAKIFLAVKKAFTKGDRSPGILGSLLTNPDGARIEAYVRDGGVQISVKPRAA